MYIGAQRVKIKSPSAIDAPLGKLTVPAVFLTKVFGVRSALLASKGKKEK